MRLDRGQIEVMDEAMVQVFRRKTPAERIQIGFAIWESARQMLTTHLKKTHPDWNMQKVQEEVTRRLLRGST